MSRLVGRGGLRGMIDLGVSGYTQVVRGKLWLYRPTEVRDLGTNRPRWQEKVRSKETREILALSI